MVDVMSNLNLSENYFKLAKACGSEEKLVELISNNIPIDDHTNEEEPRFIGCVVFDNDEVAACFNTTHYSLNRLYLDDKGDNKLHVGKDSIGSVLFGEPTSKKLADYNEDALFKKIKYAYLCDGTKIVPAA